MEKHVERDEKQRITDIILYNNHQPTTSENSPPARQRERSPSDSSLSSYQSSLSPPPASYTFRPPPDVLPPAANQSLPADLVSVTAANPVATVGEFFARAAEDGVPGDGGGGGGGRRASSANRSRQMRSTWRSAKREGGVKKAALGFRVFGFAFCLISFSVMVADRNKGWALDSFDRYIEFRYCMVVNVIGFLYSAIQALNLAYRLSSGKLNSGSHLRCIFDFSIDQMLAYLLISSSSSAAIRVDDWLSNWGEDKFPDIANASVIVSFMAFLSFASSALISGYTLLCTL